MKNKYQKFINKSMRKQFLMLCMYNLIAFLIVFLIIGFVIKTAISQVFYYGLINDLEEFSEENKETLFEDSKRIITQINNPRMILVFYDQNQEIIEDAYSEEIFRYIIEDFVYRDFQHDDHSLKEALKNPIFILNEELDKINKFEETKVQNNIYHFLTLSFEVNSQEAIDVKYCKVLIMVNGEINISRDISIVYSLASIFALLFGVIISIILGAKAIKPIGEAMYNQLQFVNDASHELKTPLSIMRSILENILTKSDVTVYEVGSDIAIILDEISRLTKLTKNLLVLADRSELNLEYVDVYEVIKNACNIFYEVAQFENKEFIIEGCSIKANVDVAKIKQLLYILIDNALKYTSPLDSIKISLNMLNTNFVLTVSDTGIGVSSETKKKIFERFYREDKARSRETGGHGLGLTIAQMIVVEHKGKIICEHNEPRGTKFIITLSTKLKK